MSPDTQQARSSSPRNGARRTSRPQYPSLPATERRNQRQVEHVVDERAQTQQRADSGCGVEQCGQRQVATATV
jgi:hypothetical protein